MKQEPVQRIEHILYPEPEDNSLFIRVGVGDHGSLGFDSVCLSVVAGEKECEIYLSKQQTRILNLMISDWFEKTKREDESE